MNKKEVQDKIMSYLDLNYNMSLYSQKNRMFLADQLSSIAVGKEAINSAGSSHSQSSKKLEGGDEFGLGGGVPINYSRADQRKIDEEKAAAQRTENQKSVKTDSKTKTSDKKTVSKKQLKKLSKSRVINTGD